MTCARIILLLVCALALVPSAVAQVQGAPPSYTDRKLGTPAGIPIPNEAAFDRRFWVPGLDDGYVPQGLTFAGGALYVSSYKSTDPKQGRGPCRLYRLEPQSGKVTGTLDLPPACGHAGGLARGGESRLWVSDTRIIFEIALGAASDPAIGKIVREIRLEGGVKGSFSASTADALWLGSYEREGAGRLFRFDTTRLKGVLTPADAMASVPLPSRSQGAAFAADGKLWITRSGHALGELLRLDPASGAVLATHRLPAGVEDLSFDPQGRLWTMSEAGSRRWLAWDTFYPVIFRLDPSRLR